jgi:dTDP-4-dehydrorhamnose reductase
MGKERMVRPRSPQVVILGGRGMLGTDLTNLCRQRGLNVKVFDLPECDITDIEQLEDAISESSAVINCAAYTNVDGAERESEEAYRANAHSVGELGAIAAHLGIYVIHISTDFVFDGRGSRPYKETDVPNPINVYGKTKLAGEQLLIASGCRCCIIRLEWTYGLAGDNFVKKIIRSATKNKLLKVVDDQIGSPTATTEAAKAVLTLLNKKADGLFHFAAAGFVSRFDMAKFIFEKLDIPVKLQGCKTGDFPTAAARPLNSRFDCSKISALLDEPIEVWQKPLEHFLTKLQGKN